MHVNFSRDCNLHSFYFHCSTIILLPTMYWHGYLSHFNHFMCFFLWSFLESSNHPTSTSQFSLWFQTKYNLDLFLITCTVPTGDEGIIRPIINGSPTVKPPKPPKSTPIVPTPSDPPDSCDDEDDPDCDDGSGSGDGSGTTTASTDGVRFSVTTTTGVGKQTTPPSLQPSPPRQPGLPRNTVPRGNGQIPSTNGVSNVIPPLFPKQPINGKPSNIGTPVEPGNEKSPVQNPVQEQQVADTASTTGMVVGIVVAAAIALLILLYAMYKYRNRDEGSYRIDESRNYNFHTSGLPAQQNGSVPKEKPHKPVKKKDSKEWYV